MVKVNYISNATASASSNLSSSDTTNTLKQPSPAANKASLLKSNDSNTHRTLNGMKQHVLWILENGKHNIQHIALLALHTT